MKYVLSFILILTVLISGCDSATLPATDSPEKIATVKQNDISYPLSLDNSEIESIDELSANFSVLNLSVSAKMFGFSSGCQSGFKIKQVGMTSFDASNFRACTAALTSFTLKPGESKTFPIELEHTGSYTKEALAEIDPGTYMLTAFLLNDQSPEVSKQFILK